jgi:murein DD-endopeptidase MepM/ murein hydrolase activator NlpD
LDRTEQGLSGASVKSNINEGPTQKGPAARIPSMTSNMTRTLLHTALIGSALALLAGCERDGSFDGDLRHLGQGIFDTSDAARQAAGQRPTPDARGIISYPGYQVAVARQGDTVESVAARVGIPATELASYNAVPAGAQLRQNEVLALPRRVAEPMIAANTVPGVAPGSAGRIDVTSLASNAIGRAEGAQPIPSSASQIAAPTGPEPTRHKVERGETAYSIARNYNVNVRALADWNGLGNDLEVREGQTLLIPVSTGQAPALQKITAPGEGSPTPEPPSASKPLPAEKPVAVSEPVKTPAAPDLGASGGAKLTMPVQGKIIRGYQKKKNDGIDIAAAAGAPVAAAGNGTVAAITKDTQQVPILVVRHDGNLLTVYANIDGLAVKKGDKVTRGQAIAKVRSSSPAFLHFEVRQGFESVDPMPYLTQ